MDQMTNPMDKLHGYYFEDLEVGMHDVFAKTITDTDIVVFAGISGDTNPVHLYLRCSNLEVQSACARRRYRGGTLHGDRADAGKEIHQAEHAMYGR